MPLALFFSQADIIFVNKVTACCCLLEIECTEIQSLDVETHVVTQEESK
jgi:hypothetical protein